MSETIYEIKRSKFIIILMWFLVFIGEAVFGGFSIFGIVSIVREDYKKFDDPNMQLIMDLFALVICLIVFCLILSVAIYMTVE